jgi:hypothetical protein
MPNESGNAPAELLARLCGDDSRSSVTALLNIPGMANEMLPLLTSALFDPTRRGKHELCLLCISMMNERGSAAVPIVIGLASDETRDTSLRVLALKVLGSILPDPSKEALAFLNNCLSDSALEIRIVAAVALLRYEPDHARAGELLKGFVERASDIEIRPLVSGFERFPALPNWLAARLSAMLGSADPEVRISAAGILFQFGHDPARAVRVIIDEFRSEDTTVRLYALSAIDYSKLSGDLLKTVEVAMKSSRYEDVRNYHAVLEIQIGRIKCDSYTR